MNAVLRFQPRLLAEASLLLRELNMKMFRPGYPVSCVLLPLALLVASGCGEEDFSEPPSGIAERLAKAKEAQKKNPQTAEELAAESRADVPKDATTEEEKTSAQAPGEGEKSGENAAKDSSETKVVEGTQPDSKPDAEASKPTVAASAGSPDSAPPTETKPSLLQSMTAPKEQASKPATDTKPEAETNRKATAKVEGETVTAGGKTVAEIDEEKDKSVADAGMSLFEKLSGGGESKKTDKPRRGNANVTRALERTGRFAISVSNWVKLQTQLAGRFYVAATPDGAKIAGSSGERSLGVLSTQVEVLGEEMVFTRTKNNVLAQKKTKKEVVTQPIQGLPAMLSSIELLNGGNTVAIGTFDGRVLARSGANIQDWDLYAQDLFAFQDERRSSARIGKESVIALRAIDTKRMLTILESGLVAAWNTEELVHPANPALEIDEKSAKDPESIVTEPKPLFELKLPKSTVLNLAFSPSRQFGAIVLSNETITIFDTTSGEVVDTLNAKHFNDTQPVSLIIEEDRKRVVVGLADGRIFRRAFADGEPVKGTNDEGAAVDYDAVFSPDLGDRSGAITAMQLKYDNRILYIGRLDGTVTLFDLPRKQAFKSSKLHSSPVIEIRSTAAGVFTIAHDRIAKLTDRAPGSGGGEEVFNLPKDTSLVAKVVVDDGKETKQDKFTRPRNFNRKVTASKDDDLVALGIRPADPVLALLQHQLRVAEDPETRETLRKRILEIVKPDSGEPESPENTPGKNPAPRMFAEVQTDLDYEARPFRRAILSVSNDGKTVAAAQFFAQGLLRGKTPNQPVLAWDTLTGTRIRAWRKSPGVLDLDLNMQNGAILPTPLSAQLRLYNGRYQVDENAGQYLTWAYRPNNAGTVVGLRGTPGVAQKMVRLLGPDGSIEKEAIEAFEGAVTSMAFSEDGKSLFVNIRERTRIRLLELNGETLEVIHQMAEESIAGTWNPSEADLTKGTLGATIIIPSKKGNLLATHGRYEKDFQLRIWKRTGPKWPQDKVQIIRASQSLLESASVTSTPLTFVNGGERSIAVIGTKGIGIISAREAEVESSVALPDIEDRRPITLLTADGKSVIAGDQEGNIWIWSLSALDRKPYSFQAHAGPISGLAMSDDAAYLVTAGQENRLRIWDARYITGQ